MSLRQPVQYPVKYYSHLDAGAPQLSDADNVIKMILKSCLVTGHGTKESAGWTSLFEDDYRIVLRRPLRTGNPPDIKIENGVINGTDSHRVVSQDNPSGLDDATELAAVELLARDSRHGTEWHLIVSDFGFILCYQMAGYGRNGDKNNMLYCGSMQKLNEADLDFFAASSDLNTARNGRAGAAFKNWLYETSSQTQTDVMFKDLRTGAVYYRRYFLTLPSALGELHLNNDYTAQKIIIADKATTPFYCSVFENYPDLVTKVIDIDGRQMLRYVNKAERDDGKRPFYIPLDYWEL